MNLSIFCVRLIFAAVLACVAATVNAAERIQHLYEAMVPIDSASTEVEDIALQQGLAQVLQKISGYSGTAGFSGLDETLRDAPQLVSEFGIRQRLRGEPQGIAAADAAMLYMRFPQEQVEALLRRYEIPQWPGLRPDTLVLVVSHLGERPWLMGRERWPALFAELDYWSWRRGVPLRLLSQQQLTELGVSARAVAELDQLALQVVAEMSQVEQIAVLQVIPSDREPTIRVDVLSGLGETFSADASGTDLSSVIGLLDNYADELSLRTAFVATASANNTLRIVVDGVRSFEQFRQLRANLRSVPQVDGLKLLRIEEDRLQFVVQFQSGQAQLQQGLLQSGDLVPVASSSLEQPSPDRVFYYRLAEPGSLR